MLYSRVWAQLSRGTPVLYSRVWAPFSLRACQRLSGRRVLCALQQSLGTVFPWYPSALQQSLGTSSLFLMGLSAPIPGSLPDTSWRLSVPGRHGVVVPAMGMRSTSAALGRFKRAHGLGGRSR